MSEGLGTGENLKWMYEGKKSTIDHEQYLLGKRITALQDDEEEKGDFFLKTQQSSVATGNVTILEKLDYESKVREDPLFQIRKNDYEHRKELLSNPLKKKRIQKVLKRALERDLQKSLQGKKRRGSASSSESDASSSSGSASSSESDNDIDERLKDKKLRELLKGKLEKELKNHKPSERYSSEEEKGKRHRTHSSERSPQRHKKRNKERRHRTEKTRKGRRRSSSIEESTKSHRHERNKKTPERQRSVEKREGYGLVCIKDNQYTSKPTKKRRERRTPTPEPEKQKYIRKHKPGFSRKLTEKELEAKRREMIQNAEWRVDQRKTIVKNFTKEEQEETEREAKIKKLQEKAEKKGVKARDFLHDMKLNTAAGGSLEDTVRRKKHKLSRKL